MNKEFIPYKQALELKELGFDEVFFTYNDDSKMFRAGMLYQQAFRWFREKYGLNYFIKSENNDWEWAAGNYWGYVGKNMATYEEVQLGCLNKLIDIIQIDKSGEWFAKNADIKIEIAKNK